NARRVLERAGLTDLAGVLVDGEELARLGLRGKPEPDAFLEAARRLGVEPARAVAVEDAEAGVEAADRAGYGLVVGVRARGDREALVAALDGRDPLVVIGWEGALQLADEEQGTSWFRETLRIALQRCARRVTVVLMGGRDAADLRERVRVPGLAFAGTYGLEI